MKTPIEVAVGFLLLATASCTTWYEVKKDQLPLIAKAFETGEPAEVSTPDGEVIRADPDRGFSFSSEREVVYQGKLDALELRQEGNQDFVYLTPRTEPKATAWGMPVSEVTSLKVEVLLKRMTGTAAVVGVAAAITVVVGIACLPALTSQLVW